MMCPRCRGNGEIVTDWDRYLNPLAADIGDEAVTECPDCYGTGALAIRATPVSEREQIMQELADEAQKLGLYDT